MASIQLSVSPETRETFNRLYAEINPILNDIAGRYGVEIVMYRNIIEIYGSNQMSKLAYEDLTKSELIKIKDTKFQLELGKDHREFINGKKNGKMNKVTKTSGCRIVFQENPNDYNMLIDLYSNVPKNMIMGVSLLEDELPAEMSFYIPESYHKRIIGVGGKNIQKIMKKLGVYVKFSSLEEFNILGGYYENEDNVICRTPSKNRNNLKDLKFNIVEAVSAFDLLEESLNISFPRQLLYCVYSNSVLIKRCF